MPVLARLFEESGFATVTLTMMPFLAQRLGCPRTAGIEYPFGHPLGRPHDAEGQRAVLGDALRVLETAHEPGAEVDLPYEWPEPVEVAYKAWQPREPSPIVAFMRQQAQQRARAAHGESP